MKSQEQWNAEHDRLVKLLAQAAEELKKYPGVTSVEIGIKETGRQLTQELAFRVYVQKKKPAAQLSPGEKIPDEILGVKTDVIEYDVPVLTSDDSKYRPLKGGIQIGNDAGAGLGTLGCIARLNSDNALVVLSNQHVMMSGKQPSDSSEIGQPTYVDCCCCSCDEIGAVVAKQLDGTVDCAIAKIKSGITATNTVRLLSGDVFGSNNAVVGTSIVTKIGRTSDKTTGTIVSITHGTPANTTEGTPARTSQILIKPEAGVTLFQDHGDSGAVLLNSDNEVVGLMWGAYLSPSNALYGHGIACPIANVLSALNITIPLGSLTTAFGAVPVMLTAPQFKTEQPEAETLVNHLQVRLSQSAEGRAVLRIIEEHRREVIDLINHNRAVTVAWHRKQGPAFLAALGRSVKTPAYKIPAEIEGITRQQAFMSMATVLSEHGSPQLKALIEKYSLPLLQWIQQYDTVEEMVRAIESNQWLEWAGALEAKFET
jgi:hypothetical protein